MIKGRNEKGQVASRPLEERLEERIRRTDTCWVWEGAKAGAGLYPVIRVEGLKQVRVSRLMLEKSGRPRPSDKHLACHTCDNPSCVNPDHLFWGTARDNAKDMAAKGRAKIPSGEHAEKIKAIVRERWKCPEFRERHREMLIRRNTEKAKRVTFKGETKLISEWAKEVGISPSALSHRLTSGWGVEKALTSPNRYRKS